MRYDVPIGHQLFGKAHVCACRDGEIAQVNAERLPGLSNLLPTQLALTLDDIAERGECTAKMLGAGRDFAAFPYGMLTVWGGPGNGKTALLIALVNHFNTIRFGEAYYVRFVDLLDIVRAGYEAKVELDARRRYERLKNIWFLAIDEMDKANMTGWASEFRARFFDDRYTLARERLCHTAIAMNDDPASLPDYLYDRLRWGAAPGANGFRIVHNADESARPVGL
ncbi:MAG TPA: hypothetical protein VIK33_17485 [Anaerolineae bacterium]